MLAFNRVAHTATTALLLVALSQSFFASHAAPTPPYAGDTEAPACGKVGGSGADEFYLHGQKIASAPVRCRVQKLEPKPRLDIVRLTRVEGVTQVCTVIVEKRQMRAPGGGDAVVEFGYVRDDGPSSMLGCRWTCRHETGFKCVKPAHVPAGSECECERQAPVATLDKV